jgi:cell division protein FtsN
MKTLKTTPVQTQQRGGFTTGLVVGLLIGLAMALAVALYVTKTRGPFEMNKVPQRTAEQDAAEAERNRNWNPNAGLTSNKGIAAAAASKPGSSAASKPAAAKPAAAEPDPAALLEGKSTVDPSASTEPVNDPFTYFVQAGAYSQPDEADQQRARLAILGMESKVTEREQAGRTTYRVRVGPFDHRDDAESMKERLLAAGIESSLVRIQK